MAPEVANNAASTGSTLPMLMLGIPGSPTTVILLGGMIVWGLEPGPLLFIEHKKFVWGLMLIFGLGDYCLRKCQPVSRIFPKFGHTTPFDETPDYSIVYVPIDDGWSQYENIGFLN